MNGIRLAPATRLTSVNGAIGTMPHGGDRKHAAAGDGAADAVEPRPQHVLERPPADQRADAIGHDRARERAGGGIGEAEPGAEGRGGRRDQQRHRKHQQPADHEDRQHDRPAPRGASAMSANHSRIVAGSVSAASGVNRQASISRTTNSPTAITLAKPADAARRRPLADEGLGEFRRRDRALGIGELLERR